jgi:hypothetical protein
MTTNLYLKIICTIIAVELFLIILKPSPIETIREVNSLPNQMAYMRYNMPNFSINQQEPTEVKIVGIELPSMRNSSNALPVLTYNPVYFDKGKAKDLLLKVQTENGTK